LALEAESDTARGTITAAGLWHHRQCLNLHVAPLWLLPLSLPLHLMPLHPQQQQAP
jgi:hypothetical protein